MGCSFGFDISIRVILLSFGLKIYLNIIWVLKIYFQGKQLPSTYNMAHGACLYVLKILYVKKGFLSSFLVILP